ncbi:MAG TPA: hypothetical protein VGW33_01970 [Terriglobia bacterium]|nr:hypothetical protein [Terriglobia bacterium]
MEAAVTAPIFGCTLVVLIVAIVSLVRIRDREAEVRWRLHHEEIEHQRRMHQLEMEHLRLKY